MEAAETISVTPLWSQEDVGISAMLIPRAMGPLPRLRDTTTKVDPVRTIFSTFQGILRIYKLVSLPNHGYFSLFHCQPCFPFSSYHNSFFRISGFSENKNQTAQLSAGNFCFQCSNSKSKGRGAELIDSIFWYRGIDE